MADSSNAERNRRRLIREERAQLQKEVRQRLVTYLIAAFGLVAGLAWNDAIRSLIEHLLPMSRNTVLAKFVYAVLITLIVVVVTVYVVRFISREEKKA